ncbi:MAG: hypothetical protein AAF570_22380 [Bacteroidota bacterium]
MLSNRVFQGIQRNLFSETFPKNSRYIKYITNHRHRKTSALKKSLVQIGIAALLSLMFVTTAFPLDLVVEILEGEQQELVEQTEREGTEQEEKEEKDGQEGEDDKIVAFGERWMRANELALRRWILGGLSMETVYLAVPFPPPERV